MPAQVSAVIIKAQKVSPKANILSMLCQRPQVTLHWILPNWLQSQINMLAQLYHNQTNSQQLGCMDGIKYQPSTLASASSRRVTAGGTRAS
jgi:hypothetical protein